MIMTITTLDHPFSLDYKTETIPACIVKLLQYSANPWMELLQCKVQLDKSALEWLSGGSLVFLL